MKTSDGLGAVRTAQLAGAALSIAATISFLVFAMLSDARCHQAKDCGSYESAHSRGDKQGFDLSGWEPTTAIDRYTLLLALFTAGLTIASIWQGYFLLRADSTARIAADAALTTAQTANVQAGHLGSSVAEAKRGANEMAKVAVEMGKAANAGAETATATQENARMGSFTAAAMRTAAEAMGKQALLTHQIYLATHRPLLVIHSIRLLRFDDNIPPDRQPVTAEFAIINAGTGKCKMVTGSAVYLEYLEPIDRPYLPALDKNDIIPLRPFDVGTTDKSIRVSSNELGGLLHDRALGEARFLAGYRRDHPHADVGDQSRRKTLYLHGWITYDEDSGHTRTTYFRREYSHDTERFSPSADPDDEKTY